MTPKDRCGFWGWGEAESGGGGFLLRGGRQGGLERAEAMGTQPVAAGKATALCA